MTKKKLEEATNELRLGTGEPVQEDGVVMTPAELETYRVNLDVRMAELDIEEREVRMKREENESNHSTQHLILNAIRTISVIDTTSNAALRDVVEDKLRALIDNIEI